MAVVTVLLEGVSVEANVFVEDEEGRSEETPDGILATS